MNSSQGTEDRFVADLTASQSALMLYVGSLMPGESVADELVQRTNAKIWQKREQFEPGTNFRAWAMAIARFEVLNYRKQQAKDSKLQFSDELEEIVASELSEFNEELFERQVALRKCLENVKPDQRQLLISRYASNEPLGEFAQKVGRTAASIKVTLSRLRRTVYECILRRLKSREA